MMKVPSVHMEGFGFQIVAFKVNNYIDSRCYVMDNLVMGNTPWSLYSNSVWQTAGADTANPSLFLTDPICCSRLLRTW